MSDSLRSKVIRLAYQQPSLRPHLLPILKVAGAWKKGDILVAQESTGIHKTVMFYSVVKATKKDIILQRVAPDVAERKPLVRTLVPTPRPIGKEIRRPIGPTGMVMVAPYVFAEKWDGTPQPETDYGAGG
jgi:hypothetical protein